MFPPNTQTPAPGSTPAAAPAQPQQQTPDYLTREEFSRSAAYIRGLSEKLDTLTKSVPTMDLFVQLGLLEKADDGSFKPKTAPAAPAKKDGQPDPVAEMEARFKAELKQRDDALAAERRKAAETEQRSAIVDALTKAGAVNPSRDVVHVSGVTRNAEGKFVQVVKDEFGAEKQISLEDAAANFLKANPELKKASGHPGSGTPAGVAGGSPAGANNDINTLASMSMDQYFAQRSKGK